MTKNKGGREIRKPKQPKKPKLPETAGANPMALKLDSASKKTK